MASRNRKGYSGSRRGNGSVLQSVGLMIFLGVTCFFLGFFVLARLLPLKDGSEKQGISTIATNTGDPPDRSISAGMSSPPANNSAPSASPPQPSIAPALPKKVTTDRALPGPSIEPMDGGKTQQPEGVDNNPTDTPSATTEPKGQDLASGNTPPTDTPVPTHRRRRRKSIETMQADDTTANLTDKPDKTASEQGNGTDDTPSTDAPVAVTPRPRRHRRRSAETQPAATELNGTDANNGDEPVTRRPPSTDDVNDTTRSVQTPSSPETSADPTPPVRTRSGYYRVVTGLFSTQEAADAEAKRVEEKNISVTVQKVQRDGRTLYRVQHALYRRRANAEAARKRLQDAGIDATVSGP